MMDKALRFQIKLRKFMKRLSELRIDPKSGGNFHSFRSHGKPCSCSICRDEKFRDKRKKHSWKGQYFNYNQ